MKKLKLPKSVYSNNNKFQVILYSKKLKKRLYVGHFETIDEAVKARDKYVIENYDILEGYNPRGISYNKSIEKYMAYLSINNQTIFLGWFDNINEAVEYRNNFINSLR